MKTTTITQINNKLKDIPDSLMNDVMNYLDFLSFKTTAYDWATDLSAKERQLIKQGEDDIKNGKIHTHNEALKIINKQLKNKGRFQKFK